jgi:uncharacterized DUF497 family protein
VGDTVLIWDLDDDPDGNVQHVAEHGLTKDEVASVFADPNQVTEPDRGYEGRFVTKGETYTGRYVVVAWEHVDDDPLTVYPVTAFEPDPDD